MIILGIDPGSRFLGYGLISDDNGKITTIDYGVLKFNSELPLAERLLEIGQGVQLLFSKFRPQHLSVEKIFLGKNADSAFKLGHARGVVIYEALRAQVVVHEYATRLVKKGITGMGSAEKEQVSQVIRHLLGLGQIPSLDATDALAMAYFHATQLRVTKLTQQMKRAKPAERGL